MKTGRIAKLFAAMAGISLLALLSSACSGTPDGSRANTNVPDNRNSQSALPSPLPSPTPTERHVTLKEATDNKFARAVLCGMGASSGAALIMAIQSAVQDRLDISLDEASTVSNSDAGSQDMVLDKVAAEYDGEKAQEIAKACVEAAEREEGRGNQQSLSENWKQIDAISLGAYETRVYLISAYCLDFEKENPGSGNKFTLRYNGNSETRRVFQYLRHNPNEFDTVAIQLATWSVNGDFGGDEIRKKFEFADTDRRDACLLLERAGVSPANKKLCVN